MYAKKLRRRCDVRGCKETATFSISRTRENGNTPIMCEKCLREALEAVKNYIDVPRAQQKAAAPPPIFPHPEAEAQLAAETTHAPEPAAEPPKRGRGKAKEGEAK